MNGVHERFKMVSDLAETALNTSQNKYTFHRLMISVFLLSESGIRLSRSRSTVALPPTEWRARSIRLKFQFVQTNN